MCCARMNFYSGCTEQHMGPMCGRHVLYGDDFYSDCSELATPIRPNVLGSFLFKTIPGKHGAQVGSTFVVLGRFLSETCPEKKHTSDLCGANKNCVARGDDFYSDCPELATLIGPMWVYTGWSKKKTEWPTSAILMQKPITPSDRTSF